MRREDFHPNAPGKLIDGGSGYLCFDPEPLPPRIHFDARFSKLLSEAERALGELSGVGAFIQNPYLLIRPFVRREAVLSSRIEGTVTRLRDLLLYEAEPSTAENIDDVEEVENYVAALEYGLSRIGSIPLCSRLIREIHQRLMTGVRGQDKAPGQFRKVDVHIGRDRQIANARFVPPGYQLVDGHMAAFERFLNEPNDLPEVVQLAIAHYQFEAIHPFMDGNGRMGRLLISLMLSERKLLRQPLLYLSAFFEARNEEYRDHLLNVSRRASWNEWIEFFSLGVIEQSRDAVVRARRLLSLMREYRQRCEQGKYPVGVLQIVERIFNAPAVTIRGLSQMLDIPFQRMQRYITILVKEQILEEGTGRSRNRVFLAKEILTLLGDGAISISEEEPPLPDNVLYDLRG